MKSIKKIILLFIAMGFIKTTAAQYIYFAENKGQWNNEVKFKGKLPHVDFYLKEDGYKVSLKKVEDLKAANNKAHSIFHGNEHQKNSFASEKGIRAHNYEVRFLYASRPTEIIAEKPNTGYENYFLGNDPNKWASNVRSFAAVTYKNIYPGIDVRYYATENNLKYDIVVSPFADVSKLAMIFEGADEIKVRNEELIIKTSVDEIKELKPYTYTLSNEGREPVHCRYSVRGNIVRFNLGNYDKSKTLVIDPSMVFTSFTGSTADNWGYTATYDKAGNLYAGGIVFGTDTYAIGNGPWFDNSFNGGIYDMYIIKLNQFGTDREYATYVGGDGREQPHSLIVDNQGRLIIAGRTNSTNYPTTINKGGGGYDIVLTMLNAGGSALINSLKIGGSNDDGVNLADKNVKVLPSTIRRNYGDDARSEVMIDSDGNIWLASSSQSSDFPLQNPFQNVNKGGANNQDAVILKLTPNLSSLLLSTYYGGTGDDAAFVLSQNPKTGEMYVGGATTSNDLTGNSTGTIYPAFQGGVADGFICMINDRNQLVKFTYIGTDGADIIFGLKFDRKGFPYITGTTTGNWPVLNAAVVNAGAKQFISKLAPDLSSYIYSTTFGKSAAIPSLSLVAFLVDRCENVYVSGWGGTTNASRDDYIIGQNTFDLPVTQDAVKKVSDGSDMYFYVLEKNATSILYASYFGQDGDFGEHVDGGTSRFDDAGIIYQAVCANCAGTPGFPTAPIGVWSQKNNSGGKCNMAMIKMSFNLSGIISQIQSSVSGDSKKQGCAPLKVDFTDAYGLGKKYIWVYDDNSKNDTTTTPTSSHTFVNPGYYNVKLVVIDSASCNIRDTSFVTIRVRNDVADLEMNAKRNPPCQQLNYTFFNTSSATKPFGNNSFIWNFGDGTRINAGHDPVSHSYSAPGTYKVWLVLTDTSFCNVFDSVSMDINVADFVKAKFQTDSVGCAPYNAQFNYTGAGGQSFNWNFGDNSGSSQTNPAHVYNTPGIYPVTLIVTDSNTCNITDTARFSIRVSEKPTASYDYMPKPTELNKPVSFINQSAGASRYKWIFGDGEELVTTVKDSIIFHDFSLSGTYNVCLVAINESQCADTTCKPIEVKVLPVFGVPSAFSPNADGVNDVLYVKGYGIKTMNWKIYNRWGNLVFESVSIKSGWDGKTNGVLQPQDVYIYVLDVEFIDGTKSQKKGDVTLLR